MNLVSFYSASVGESRLTWASTTSTPYGHVEYLTRQEIQNLRDRGESIEELDGPASNKYPPHCKNPANQAYVNEMFYEEQRRKAEERRQRRGGRGGRGGRASTDFGTGNTNRYGDNRYSDPVHGTTSDGRDVTASFGREGTSREGHSLLRDGHAESPGGPNGAEQHDHYDGRGGGTRRGKHSG